QHHVTGGVARRVKNVEGQRPERETVAVGEHGIGPSRLLERDAVHAGLRRAAIVERQIGWVKMNRDVPRAFHTGDAANVVDVRVRQPDRLQRRAGCTYHLDETLWFVAGIDERGDALRFVDDEIAVLGE